MDIVLVSKWLENLNVLEKIKNNDQSARPGLMPALDACIVYRSGIHSIQYTVVVYTRYTVQLPVPLTAEHSVHQLSVLTGSVPVGILLYK
jgi:hypothetical protein